MSMNNEKKRSKNKEQALNLIYSRLDKLKELFSKIKTKNQFWKKLLDTSYIYNFFLNLENVNE